MFSAMLMTLLYLSRVSQAFEQPNLEMEEVEKKGCALSSLRSTNSISFHPTSQGCRSLSVERTNNFLLSLLDPNESLVLSAQVSQYPGPN